MSRVSRSAVAYALALGLGALAPTSARAQLEEAVVGVWVVSSHFRQNAFSHCAMSARYLGGAKLLLFALGRSGFQVGMYDRNWNLPASARVSGYYRINRGPRIAARGVVVNPQFILLGLATDTSLYGQFQSAGSVVLGVDGSPEFETDFNLQNGVAAFARLALCARAGLDHTGPPPAARHPPPAAERPAVRAPAPPRPAAKPADPLENAIGTGFFVSPLGHIVTAEHVVRGCKALRAQAIGDAPAAAVLIAKSESDDLALLKVAAKPPAVAPLRPVGMRLGEAIVLFGFPLPGALASSGNLTTGNVSALAGLKDDHRVMQVSAPAQPGNSGGPVIDLKGRVSGVLVHSISAARVARETGMLPQNVNFAVKASVVASFLEAHGVAAHPGGAEADLAVADVAERARGFTVRIECLRQ
ncbi:MAG: serine protease [Alphaproteobacteria bacterium]